MDGADKAIEWHKRVFGEDYYLEVILHKTEVPGLSLDLYHQQKVNAAIFELAKKHGVKVVATKEEQRWTRPPQIQSRPCAAQGGQEDEGPSARVQVH